MSKAKHVTQSKQNHASGTYNLSQSIRWQGTIRYYTSQSFSGQSPPRLKITNGSECCAYAGAIRAVYTNEQRSGVTTSIQFEDGLKKQQYLNKTGCYPTFSQSWRGNYRIPKWKLRAEGDL